MKKFIRLIGAALILGLVFFLAVKVFLPTEKIRDLALAQAREKLGRPVDVGPVAVSLRGGLGIRLADFVIHNPEGFKGDPLLVAKALDLKLELRPLLKREVRVNRLVIDTPQLNLVKRDDGQNNFTFPSAAKGQDTPATGKSPTKGSAAPALSVDHLELKSGQLVFSDEDQQTTRLNGLDIDLVLTEPQADSFHSQGKFSIAHIALPESAQVPAFEAGFDFDLNWDTASSTLQIVELSGRALDIPLQGSGRIQFPAGKAPVADIEATAQDIDLTILQPYLTSGQIGGRADLALAVTPQAYSGTLKAKGVSFTDSGLLDQLLNLDATLEFTPEKIVCKESNARFNSGTFTMTGKLLNPFPYFLPPELQGQGAMKTPHLVFELHSPRLDVDRLLPAASPSPALGDRFGDRSGDGSRGASARPPALTDLEFPGLTSDGTFSADSLLYMQVPFTRVHGKARIRDRRLSVYDVQSKVYGGSIAAKVLIDLNNLNDPTYTGEYHASGMEVNNFLDRFVGLKGTVFGGCDLNGEFSTHGRDPEVIRNGLTLNALADLRDGRLVTSGETHDTLQLLANQAGATLDPEQRLKDLATHILVSDGRVELDSLQTGLGQFGQLSLSGFYSFTGALDYQGQLNLTAEQTKALFSGNGALGALGKLLGDQRPTRLSLPLSVGGSRQQPKVKLGLGAVAEDLQKRALQQQGQKLEDKAKSKLDDLLRKWR